MKKYLTITVMVSVLLSVADYAGAYSPSDFTDVFNLTKSLWYCSQSSSVNGVAGASGVCAGGLYYYTENVAGFKDLNNPNDPKRLCQKDTPPCNPQPQTMYLGGTYLSHNNYDGAVPSLFRIYLPPGTTGIGMQLYVSPVSVAAVVRMGQPPANPNKPFSEYQSIQSTGLLVNDLMNGGDFWTRNGDGIINIFYGGGYIDQSALLSKAFSDRWLYVQIVGYASVWLEKLTFYLTIGDMAAYTAWYNSVNWDCYNNPGSAACSGIPSPTSYTVTFTASTGGTVSSASQTVISGNSTTAVTAIPDTNYTFVNWTGQNGFTSTSNPLTVSNVTANATYTANFTLSQTTQYTITFAPGPGGSISGNTSQTVSSGGTATAVTATPNTGYKFINWTGSNGYSLTSNPLTVSNVTASATYTANFQQITQYTVNFLAGINGTINGGSSTSQTVSSGGTTTAVTATPNSSYQFVNWTGTNGFTSTTNPLTVSNVSSNMAVVANFQSIPAFTVTFLAGTGGFVIGDSVQRVNQNNNTATVTARAESGYQFVNWTGTGGFTASTGNPLIVQNVTYDKTITANFAQTPTSSQKLDVFVDVPQDRIGRFSDPYIISNDKAKAYSSVVIEPTLQFHNLPSGKYDLYAAILVDGVLYLATKDILSQIVFVKWMGEDDVRSYDSKDFSGDQTYLFNVFENIKIEPLPSPQALAGIGAHFFVAIAPSGSSYLNDFINIFRGSEIYFSPDIR